jgi:glyoxylase-like metal-dependent hydrolase (beta-lactamase superfamily II)
MAMIAMMRRLPAAAGVMFAASGLWLSACSSAPTTQSLANEAAAAMGGLEKLRGVQNVAMRDGTGTRLRLGQMVHATDVEAPASLAKVAETLDLAGGRAVLDYEIKVGDFSQHRQEILTKKGGKAVGLENVAGRPLAVTSPSGLFSWGTQNSPEFLLKRNVIAIVLAAADTASSETPQTRDFAGTPHAFGTARLASGETIGLYFNPQTKLLDGFEATDTETMLGDQPAVYTLADYRDVNTVKLPFKVTIAKGGKPYSEVQFGAASINDANALSVFTIPDAATAEVDKAIAAGDYSPVAIDKVADGVYFARAYSHNSLVVEFPTFLAVVDAAYTDAQSATLARVLAEQFPGKPIRYAAVTHYHYDHTGGVRRIAAAGATIVADKAHEPMMRPIVEAPHTNPPDALELAKKAGKAGSIEFFEGKKVISDGGQSLELYAITGNPHVDPMVLAFVPSSGVLFQSDLFFPGTGAPAGPDATHLLASVRALKLNAKINAGGHGGVGPFGELEKAVAAAQKPK